MKTIRTGRVVIGIFIVSVVLGGRLLYMCSPKSDRPSELRKDKDKQIQAERRLGALAETMWQAQMQSYQQKQEMERRMRPDPWEEYKKRQALDAQIRREEYIRERAREAYRNDTREGRAMKTTFGY